METAQLSCLNICFLLANARSCDFSIIHMVILTVILKVLLMVIFKGILKVITMVTLFWYSSSIG